jgi:hypothetical protein
MNLPSLFQSPYPSPKECGGAEGWMRTSEHVLTAFTGLRKHTFHIIWSENMKI